MRARGFSLIELLVVIAVVAIASAGVMFVLPDRSAAKLEEDGQRLAAMLEAARAASRASGQPVSWHPEAGGFRFEGDPARKKPSAWLSAQTRVEGAAILNLGPDPIISRQSLTLYLQDKPQYRVIVSTDGVRPFKAGRSRS